MTFESPLLNLLFRIRHSRAGGNPEWKSYRESAVAVIPAQAGIQRGKATASRPSPSFPGRRESRVEKLPRVRRRRHSRAGGNPEWKSYRESAVAVIPAQAGIQNGTNRWTRRESRAGLHGRDVVQNHGRQASLAEHFFGVQNLDAYQLLAGADVEAHFIGQSQRPALILALKQADVEGVNLLS